MTPADPLRTSYDRVAASYAAHIADELAGKPLDRALLAAFAEQARPLGPIADLGCGPGHVAAFLADAGADVVGIDLSEGMLAQAAQRFPRIAFRQGDLRALDVADAALGGIVAFYSIIHLAREELLPAFREWRRTLRPGGFALVAFHAGDTVTHYESWWDAEVDLDFHWLPADVVSAALREAGLTIAALVQRAPYAGVEYPSDRVYLLAQRAGDSPD